MKLHCFSSWHLIEVIIHKSLIIMKDTVHIILFCANFIHDKTCYTVAILSVYVILYMNPKF